MPVPLSSLSEPLRGELAFPTVALSRATLLVPNQSHVSLGGGGCCHIVKPLTLYSPPGLQSLKKPTG